MIPPLKKVKKKQKQKKSFSNFFFKFQWKIYIKNCLYNQVHVLVHTEEKTKKERLSLSLACDERFVSTDTLWLHGQAFDVLYEMSEPQRICLHLTILRKKNIIPLAHQFASPKSLSHSFTPKIFCISLSLSLQFHKYKGIPTNKHSHNYRIFATPGFQLKKMVGKK